MFYKYLPPVTPKPINVPKRKSDNRKKHVKSEQLALDLPTETVTISYLTFCRLKKKISQDTLAKLLGFCRISLYSYENKKANKIPKLKLEKIAEFFKEPIRNFKRNKGLITLDRQTFNDINYTNKGYKRFQRHNVNKINQPIITKPAPRFDILSMRWGKIKESEK